MLLAGHKNGILLICLVQAAQIQEYRLGVVEPCFLRSVWGEFLTLRRGHQLPQQVLPKDIPAVLHEELLAQLLIAEGKHKFPC